MNDSSKRRVENLVGLDDYLGRCDRRYYLLFPGWKDTYLDVVREMYELIATYQDAIISP